MHTFRQGVLNTTRLLLICLSAAPVFGFGSVYDYRSTIPGTGYWEFAGTYKGRSGEIARLSYYSNPEFAEYCDGQHKIYLYEIETGGFICKLVEPVEPHAGESTKWISIDNVSSGGKEKLKSTLKAAKAGDVLEEEGSFYVLVENLRILPRFYGLYTVSMTPLNRGNWSTSKPTADERKAATLVAQANRSSIKIESGGEDSYDWVIGQSDSQLDAVVEKSTTNDIPTGNWMIRPTKIKTDEIELYVLPAIVVSQAMGWNLISAVVRRDNGVFKYVGSITGCVSDLGADIDRDGFPELITFTCEENEAGGRPLYYKLFPAVKVLISG